MAYVITIDGEIQDLGPKPNLKKMQTAVGGFIERVCLGDTSVYVNEEGLFYGLPTNHSFMLATGVELVGNVIVMENGDEDEE